MSVKPIVPDCTASLKVAVTGDETATPVAFHAGEQVVTAGAEPVVNDQLKGLAIVLPVASVTPLMVAV